MIIVIFIVCVLGTGALLEGWEGIRYGLAVLSGICALFSLLIIVEFFVLRQKLPPGSY